MMIIRSTNLKRFIAFLGITALVILIRECLDWRNSLPIETSRKLYNEHVTPPLSHHIPSMCAFVIYSFFISEAKTDSVQISFLLLFVLS